MPSLASAQDFGVMESAETINRGNFKVSAFPVFVLQNGPVDNAIGAALIGGFGLTDSLDVEGKVAFYDDLSVVGGDVEYWFVKNSPLDLSVRGGYHFGFSDTQPSGLGNSHGLDVSFIGSGPVSPRLEVFGAIDLGFSSFDLPDALEGTGIDTTFTDAHLVPGIEYAISPTFDFLGSIGIGLNDSSSNYIAIGVSFYFQ
jgi:hypothetical protein